jgi:glycerate kinase
MGKVPGEVLKVGIEMGKPVYAICGSNGLNNNGGFTDIFSLLGENINETEAMNRTTVLIKDIAQNMAAKMINIYG